MRSLIADPIVLAGVGVLAALGLRRFAPRLAGTWLALVAAVTYGLSTPALSGLLLRGLEPELSVVAAGRPAEAIVVLGATLRHEAPEFGGDTVGALTLERLRYGARMQRRTGLPVLVTGGTIGESEKAVGLAMAETLEADFRTPVRWIETDARNTYENARLSADLLRRDGIDTVMLVTHAWHMARAAEAFEHAGLMVIPAPTGFTVSGPGWQVSDFLPRARALDDSALALHEWVGRLWYRLRYY